jgi:hypothetical protein
MEDIVPKQLGLMHGGCQRASGARRGRVRALLEFARHHRRQIVGEQVRVRLPAFGLSRPDADSLPRADQPQVQTHSVAHKQDPTFQENIHGKSFAEPGRIQRRLFQRQGRGVGQHLQAGGGTKSVNRLLSQPIAEKLAVGLTGQVGERQHQNPHRDGWRRSSSLQWWGQAALNDGHVCAAWQRDAQQVVDTFLRVIRLQLVP